MVVRAEWQGAPSCIRRIPMSYKLPWIRHTMHISQFKFVPEFWLKQNGIILWKIKHDLVSKPSICYTVCLRMLNRPQTCKPQPFCSHIELPNQRKTSIPCQAGKQICWKNLKYAQSQNNITEIKRSFFLLLLHKTSVVITRNSLGRRWRDLQPSQRPLHFLQYKHIQKGRN